MIDKRQRKFEEPSRMKVEDMIDNTDAQVDEEEERKEEKEYQRSVAKDKSPIYGNLQVEHKPKDTMRFLSVNVNGLPFWWHDNPKANHLKFILKQYQIDGLGLQEPCINWSAFKSSHGSSSHELRSERRFRLPREFSRPTCECKVRNSS